MPLVTLASGVVTTKPRPDLRSDRQVLEELPTHRGEALRYALEALDARALHVLLTTRTPGAGALYLTGVLDTPIDDLNEPGGERDVARERMNSQRRGGAPQGSSQETMLHYLAARAGGHKCAKVLLELNASPSVRERWQAQTPLHVAARTGNVDMARVLCKHGAQLTALDATRSNALHLAARGDFADFCAWAVKHGLPVDGADGQGRSPLHLAAMEGSAGAAVRLMELKADAALGLPASDRTPLHTAVRHRRTNCVEALLRVCGGGLLHEQDDEGKTPLHEAVADSVVPDNDTLILRDPTNAGPKGEPTANARSLVRVRAPDRHCSAGGGAVAMVEALLRFRRRASASHAASASESAHASPSPSPVWPPASPSSSVRSQRRRDRDGACAREDLGVPVNVLEVRTFKERRTALHLAIALANPAAVEALLRHGADVYAQDGGGVTALEMLKVQAQVRSARLRDSPRTPPLESRLARAGNPPEIPPGNRQTCP